jgi:hypothetical protein
VNDGCFLVARVAPGSLAKALEWLAADEDGRHYTRVITNVGPQTKLLVGNPMMDSSGTPPSLRAPC